MAVFNYEDSGAAEAPDGWEFVSVTNQGGSKRVTIPTDMAAEIGVEFGDQVAVRIEDGEVVVKPL